ncbi:unnamed protein product [Caenorhabditis auriculariae]|uniref:Uncharacterized protein n=1 Tax=Caenorhabditis auriculariae TaxID=2777116 RepID=A0A8S1H540_9PELO|nr:unnamed protein product [Caenorhabditis auriculariae]
MKRKDDVSAEIDAQPRPKLLAWDLRSLDQAEAGLEPLLPLPCNFFIGSHSRCRIKINRRTGLYWLRDQTVQDTLGVTSIKSLINVHSTPQT